MKAKDNNEKSEQKRKPDNRRSLSARWMAVGIAVGCAIGLIIDNLTMGIAIGISIGIAMDLAFNQRG